MGSIRCLWSFLVPVITALLLCGETSWAQNSDVGMDPAKCEQLQRQIDSVMSVYDSPTMSESEKVVALANVWGQALATMLKSTANDPDASKIATEMADTIKRVLATADRPGGSADKGVSAETKRGADILKNRLKPYLAVMKMMCPDLVVPDIVK